MKTFTFISQFKNGFKSMNLPKKLKVFLLLGLLNLSVYAQTTWTGAVDSNWFDPGNWTSGVPSYNTSINQNVIIPITPNNPTIGSYAIYYIAGATNLTIEPGAQLTIAPYGVLAVWGILTNNAGISGILIEADETGVLPMGTLAFQNDVSINPVPATIKFFSKSYTDITDPLNPDYKWQYFGIPFTDYVPGITLGKFKPYRWDETFTNNINWQIVEPNETMKPVSGYAITQDEPTSYNISGYLNNNWFENNQIDTVLSYTTGNGSDYPGNHILSNPFMMSLGIQSDIIFENMEASIGFYNTGSLADWSLDPGTSGTNPGQYLNVPQQQAGYDGLPSLIPTMQGFLVNATQSTSKITFKPTSGLINVDPLRAKNSKSTPEKICTTIDIAGSKLADKVWLFTEPNCTKAFDNGWDSRKITGSSAAPQLYVTEEGENFQVSSFDDINGTFLGFSKGIDSEYTMTFTHSNTEQAYPNGLYLMDLVEGKTIDISASGSTYKFVQNAISQVNRQRIPSELENVRFKIMNSPGTVTDINNSESLINVFVSDRSIVVDNKTGNQAELVLYNVAGKIVMRKTIMSGISTLQANIPTGAYIANVIAEKTNIKSSIIIK